MAKLYSDIHRNQFIWAVTDNKDKGRPPKCLYAPDQHCEWEKTTLCHGHCLVGAAYPVGMYDTEGFYCVHLPPIPGAEGKRGKSRYVRHPLANDAARIESERDVIEQRYGGNPLA